jgi:hypothetical protein
MPPGFSFELFVGGLLNAEFFVNPAIGALSSWLCYALACRFTSRPVAACLALTWAAAPIVIWGSIGIFADLSAACGLLLTYFLLESKHPGLSGLALGASVGVRPSDLLFAPSALAGRSRSELLPFAIGLLLGLGGWTAFAVARYGVKPYPMYVANLRSITYEHAGHQLWFMLLTTFKVFPLLFPLAVVGAARHGREYRALLVWPLSIVLFYAGWRWRYGAWWWTRHIFPAYPALAVLGFIGAADLERRLKRFAPRLGPVIAAGAFVANLGWSLHFALSQGLFAGTIDAAFESDARRVRRLVPAQSLVGGLMYSGPLRLYGGLESFRWDSPDAPHLIDDALDTGRAVFVLIEPDEYGKHPAALALRKRYALRGVASLRHGYVLRRVQPRAPEQG